MIARIVLAIGALALGALITTVVLLLEFAVVLLLEFAVDCDQGARMHTGFLCRTPEAAMQMGVAVDTLDKDAAIDVGFELMRAGACVNLYPFPPEVLFVESGDVREKTQVWRAEWAGEVWYAPVQWNEHSI